MKNINDYLHQFIFRGSAPVAVAFLAVLLLAAGCDNSGGLTNDDSVQSVRSSRSTKKGIEAKVMKSNNMPANVKLEIKYDQKTYTFATRGSSVNALSMLSGTSSGKRMLKNYENRTYVIQYDKNGHLSEHGRWPEGDANRTMPQELYERVKQDMPEHAANYDPVVRWELKNGTFNYYSRSGQKVFSSHVGTIKHPQARALAIDSTIRANQLPLKKRIARSTQAMHQSGLSFHKVGSRSRYAMMSQKAGAKDADNIASYQQVMDLATGRAIQESVKLRNGHYASRSLMSYSMAGRVPGDGGAADLPLRERA